MIRALLFVAALLVAFCSLAAVVAGVFSRPAPVSTPAHHGPCSRKTTLSAPAAIPVTCDPAKPSQDFLGLILGAIGCLPASTPAV